MISPDELRRRHARERGEEPPAEPAETNAVEESTGPETEEPDAPEEAPEEPEALVLARQVLALTAQARAGARRAWSVSRRPDRTPGR
jgi:hypothetical protein